MKKMIDFLKNILMIQDTCNQKIGLCQFKQIEKAKPVVKEKVVKEVKLSDLMRHSA